MRERAALVFAFAAIQLMSCSSSRDPAINSLLASLMPGGEVTGWEKEGSPEEYEGESLYIYINGGADIYQEYGFRRVALQEYRNATGRSVSLEIFEMETPAAAFGMFTFKRSGKGEAVALGAGAELESYYLNFWKGRFLATLTGFDEDPATVEGLLALGAAVDARIRETGDRPAIAGALPQQGLRPGRVKYVRGLLGLNSIYAFSSARGLGFEQGIAGTYENGATLIILEYGSADAADGSLAELSKALSVSGEFTGEGSESAGILAFLDAKGRSVCLTGSVARLLVAVGPERAACLELIDRAR